MPRVKRKGVYGQGSVYRRGHVWWVKWHDGGRPRYKGGFASKDAAERVRAHVALELAAGRVALPGDDPSIPTLGKLATAWLDRRDTTHRSARADRSRWTNHVGPFFGGYRPGEVDTALIRAFVEEKLAGGDLTSTTVRLCTRLLSTFFADLVERRLAATNPVKALPRETRRLTKPSSDPSSTPFLEKIADVARVFKALTEPFNVMFAVGALAGLRPGEIIGLQWDDVDLPGRRIQVRQQAQDGELTVLKDNESRVAIIMESLEPILIAWKKKTGGEGQVFQPTGRGGGRTGRPARYVRPHTLHAKLRASLEACKLPVSLTFYQCSRHTFASQWVLAGGSMEKLAVMLGHSSTEVTRRYAHLRPDMFLETDYQTITVDLADRYKLATGKAKKGSKKRRK